MVTTLRQCPDKAPGHGNLEALGSLAVLEPPNDPPLQKGVGNSIGRQSHIDLQYRFFTETLPGGRVVFNNNDYKFPH